MITPARQIIVLLVAEPGIMHQSLYSILQSFPGALIAQASGALTAYDHLQDQAVDALVIGANLPLAERVALLERVRKQFSPLRCVVLTTTTRNHELLREAGADAVLLQDCTPQDIRAALFDATES